MNCARRLAHDQIEQHRKREDHHFSLHPSAFILHPSSFIL